MRVEAEMSGEVLSCGGGSDELESGRREAEEQTSFYLFSTVLCFSSSLALAVSLCRVFGRTHDMALWWIVFCRARIQRLVGSSTARQSKLIDP